MNFKKIISRLFMAFGKGQASTEGSVVKRYIGVAPVQIVAVNPTKAKMEELFNTSLDKEPEYYGTMTNFNGENVAYARVTFIVKPIVFDEEYPLQTLSFFIRKEHRFNRDKTKIQVLDSFGNTGWATKEELANHATLMSAKGNPLKIATDYRPAYVGEAELVDFIKNFLCLPDAFSYVNNSWVLNDKKDDAVARFDNVNALFLGNVSEVMEAINLRPENKVKVLFGVRTAEDGKLYQNFYKEMFLRNSNNDYTKLNGDVADRKAAGAYPSTEFEVCNLKEYNVTPTEFKAEETPTAPEVTNPWFNS